MESIYCEHTRKGGMIIHVTEVNVMSSALKKTVYTGLVAALSMLPLKESFAQTGPNAGHGNGVKTEQVDTPVYKSALSKALGYAKTGKGIGIVVIKGADNADVPDDVITSKIIERLARDTVKGKVFFLHGEERGYTTGHLVCINDDIFKYKGKEFLNINELKEAFPMIIEKYKSIFGDHPAYTMK